MPEEPTPTPTPPAPAGEDTSVIRHMRSQIEAEQKARKEAETARATLEAQLKERERAEMAEVDRLKAQLGDHEKTAADFAALRDEHGRFQSAFQGLYESELAAVPDDKRQAVENLSKQGAWPDRLEALRSARALIGAPAPPPTVAGTTTQPGSIQNPPSEPPQPKPFDPANPPAWGDILKPVAGTSRTV